MFHFIRQINVYKHQYLNLTVYKPNYRYKVKIKLYFTKLVINELIKYKKQEEKSFFQEEKSKTLNILIQTKPLKRRDLAMKNIVHD